MSLSSVGSDHVPDGGTAEGALAGAVKLLHGAAEAHAHVPAAVQHTVLTATADSSHVGKGQKGQGQQKLQYIVYTENRVC